MRRLAHVVAKQLPGDGDSGGRQRIQAFIRFYASTYDEVIVSGFGRWDGDVPPNATINAFAEPELKWRQAAKASAFAMKWYSKDLAVHIASTQREGMHLHVDFPQMMSNISNHIRPDIVDFHNIEWQLMASRIGMWSHPSREMAMLEVRRLRSFEIAVARRAYLVTCCSETDAAELRGWGARPLVVPNGVSQPPDRWVPLNSNPARVLFVGSFDYPPNIDALKWMVSEVWPHVAEMQANARLVVAGRHARNCADELGGLSTVEVHDSPRSLHDLYASADLCIVPLLSGGGTKIKLLEAVAHGRMVVSTSVGMQGLDQVHEFVRVADGTHDFAAAVGESLASPDLKTLSSRAFEHGREFLSWSSSMEMLSKELSNRQRRNAGTYRVGDRADG
jgi:glycosyltransferase involved in cell wall biosynthesis